MKRKTLLFIDDDPDLLNVWKNYFSRKNYRVMTALSGSEGLTISTREKPDLVILDIREVYR